MLLPEPISALVAALSRLPGIGPRSAERLALHLAQTDSPAVRQLAEALLNAREKIRACSLCGALTERDPCVLCADERRDAGSICVVERPVDVFSLEKAGVFHGKYHVLGGRISPLNGVEPEDLRIAAQARRGAKISRLAYGLPAGSGLEFADEITLGRALEGRRDLAP